MYRLETMLPFEASSASAGREFVRQALDAAQLTAATDVAVLLTSELVTNAIQHGGPPVVLSILAGDAGLTVSVKDAGPDLPVRDRGERLADRGRGLRLVESMADRWGCEMADGTSKSVWFHLP